MCRYCNANDAWVIQSSPVTNTGKEVAYILDLYTQQVVEIQPGKTEIIGIRVVR